jgi:protein TonB
MQPGSGVTNPTILRQIDPKYTPDAMRAKIQGIVTLEAVVGTNGVITDVRVIKSLDRAFGLDEEAIRTAKLWLFRPGRFQGQAVPVVVVIEMAFRLH